MGFTPLPTWVISAYFVRLLTTSALPHIADLSRTLRDFAGVPTAEMYDRDQDAETVLAALRMTSRTTLGFDSMGT